MTAIDGELLVRIDDGIAHVTLNRPQARNALTFGMYEELAKLCALAGTADDVDHIKAIIIAGAGDKAFAAGILVNSPPLNRPKTGCAMKQRSKPLSTRSNPAMFRLLPRFMVRLRVAGW